MTRADLPYIVQTVAIAVLSVAAIVGVARVWWLVRQRQAEMRRMRAEWNASVARVYTIIDGREGREPQ